MQRIICQIGLVAVDLIGRFQNPLGEWEPYVSTLLTSVSDCLLCQYFDYDFNTVVYFNAIWYSTLVSYRSKFVHDTLNHLSNHVISCFFNKKITEDNPFIIKCEKCKKDIVIPNFNLPFEKQSDNRKKLYTIIPNVVIDRKDILKMGNDQYYHDIVKRLVNCSKIYCNVCEDCQLPPNGKSYVIASVDDSTKTD